MSEEFFQVGKTATLSRIISAEDVEVFSRLSLDNNPVHFDDEYAAKAFFPKRIAHGMLGAALISGALTKLMGGGNVWLSASLRFEKPIYIGDRLDCDLAIIELDRRAVASVAVKVKNASGELVISGTIHSMSFVSRPLGG